MVASILKIVITRNTICDNLVSFPKSGHNYNSQLTPENDNITGTVSSLGELET